jgi:hypothetical protein
MASTTLERRIGALEALTLRYGGNDGEYIADIGGEDGRYWIDGIEVTQHEFVQRMPPGPFVVSIGDEVRDEK